MQPIITACLTASLIIAGCSISVKTGTGENEAPGTLYLFNLNPPEHRIFVYEQLLRKESWDKAKDILLGGSPYELRPAAVIDGQRYATIPLRPRVITLRIAGESAPPETQRNFNPEHPGAGPIFEALPMSVDSDQHYYAVAYSRSFSETARNFLVKSTSLNPLILLQEKWQGLGDTSVRPISENDARQLFASLKPQGT